MHIDYFNVVFGFARHWVKRHNDEAESFMLFPKSS